MKACGRKVRNFDDEIWKSKCREIVKQGNTAKVLNWSNFIHSRVSRFAVVVFVIVSSKPGIEEAAACDSWQHSGWSKSTWSSLGHRPRNGQPESVVTWHVEGSQLVRSGSYRSERRDHEGRYVMWQKCWQWANRCVLQLRINSRRLTYSWNPKSY